MNEIDLNVNVKKLKSYKLPVITSASQLFKTLCISDEQKKLFFYSKSREKLYRVVFIPKRDGSSRKLEIPIESLKIIQKAINKVILSKFNMSKEANAYIKKKSILTNALPHLKCQTLIKIDIKDFFPSIGFKQIYRQFRFFGYGNDVSKYLTLLCVNSKYVLPQGAPTSPSLSNLIGIILDSRIAGYCSKHNLSYTRYADDIAISSKDRLINDDIENTKRIVFSIIDSLGFKPNYNKCHVFRNGTRLEVTGIIVNDKISISKKKTREIENAIRYIKKYGLKNHIEHLNIEKSNYIGHLYGLANFIKMVDKKKGEAYLSKLNELDLKNV